MWEECTLEYIGWVRARFGVGVGVGVWSLRKQSRMEYELKLLRGFMPPLERLQMLALPFP